MRWLLLALLLGFVPGVQGFSPPPSQLTPQDQGKGEAVQALPPEAAPEEGVKVAKGDLLKLIDRAEALWGYFPTLEDLEVARALRFRALKGKPLTLLFPVEDIHNPVSYSNTFFLGQLVWKNVAVKHGVFKEKGEDAVLILDKEVYLLRDGEALRLKPERAAAYIAWWREAWKRARKYDALNYARDIYMAPRRQLYGK
jgi:hypothetical protein